MELVAAAKMRRAVAAALKSRAYANLAWSMVTSLRDAVHEHAHPLLRTPSNTTSDHAKSRIVYIVMASDRGLCGGFNAALFRELMRDVRAPHSEERSDEGSGAGRDVVQFITIGKKAEQFVRKQGWKLEASFVDMSVAPKVAELRPVARLVMEAFTEGRVDEVRIAFTDFISSLRQRPLVRTLLPLRRFEELGPQEMQNEKRRADFLFAPDAGTILEEMLPRLVELQVYQAYLDTGASEHSARMLAMRSASDAAGDMIGDLTLSLNQARQSAITQEISEISAGRAALAV